VGKRLEYPLNPVDTLLLATHASLRRRGDCGLGVALIADVQGSLESSKVRAAARQLGRDHPALSAHMRSTRLL
jgi:hypothetical protein